MKSEKNLGLMAEIASLYFEHGFTQQEIADKLYFSRSKISRLLTKAVEYKVVEFSINYPIDRLRNLEQELVNKFKIEHAIVIKDYDTSYETTMKRIGQTAAQYLDEVLLPDYKLGITWGSTVYHVVNALKTDVTRNIHAFQLMGASEGQDNPEYNAGELVYKVISKYGGKVSQVFAPLVVENDYIRDSLIKDKIIRNVIEQSREVDIVITSVGEFKNSITKAWVDVLTTAQRQDLIKKGAVGMLLGHIIKIDGQLLDSQLDKKVIGITLEDLKSIKNVIAVAVGGKKHQCVLAALNGGYINTLIINEPLALKLLSKNGLYR